MSTIKKFLYNPKIAPYVFISPFLFTFIVFFVYPMLSTFLMSFQKIVPGSYQWVGISNYLKLLKDPVFFTALGNSFKYMILTCLILIPIPMIFATVLNSNRMFGSNLFRSILYLPALTSVVVAGTIFRLAFSEQSTSLANSFIGFFGMAPIGWLRNNFTGFSVLILLCCWRWTGVNIMYFISGLQSIPDELYESADIDGATNMDKLTKITMPLLKPTTIYVLTISIYAGLAMFTESMMLWLDNKSPKNFALTIVGYLYKQGVEKNDFGYGSTVGIILLIVAMAFNIFQLKINGLFSKEGE